MISAYVRDIQRYSHDRQYWLVGVSPNAVFKALNLLDGQDDIGVCVYISGAIPDDIKLRLHDLLKEQGNEDLVPYLQGNHLRFTFDSEG